MNLDRKCGCWYIVLEDWIYLYYLNVRWDFSQKNIVLEDWIYLYYLNKLTDGTITKEFLRTEFICIIWTVFTATETVGGSWGLNLFVLFEQVASGEVGTDVLEDWIYLYYLNSLSASAVPKLVLEDWIYLYYLNLKVQWSFSMKFLRTEFICIIWTNRPSASRWSEFLRTEFICIIWT